MAGEDASRHNWNFAHVLRREYIELWRRRPRTCYDEASRAAKRGRAPPPALYGVALSGGGIRSASFCLGALQALDQRGLAERIDYLSTVSGGGFIGSSMISAMRQNGERFPFSTGNVADMHDNEPVANLRDNSRYLAPRGAIDLVISLAIVLRGLVVNFILLMALVVLPLATVMIATNPTKDHLARSIVEDLVRVWVSDDIKAHSWFKAVAPYLTDPFLISKTLGVLLLVVLVLWALQRSLAEARGRRSAWLGEPDSLGARWGKTLIVMLAVALFMEVQPPILLWFMNVLEARYVTPAGVSESGSVLGTLATLAAALVSATAAFRSTLTGWIQKALTSPSYGAWLKGLAARTVIYTAGIVVPVVIYLLFLMLTVWGIKPPACLPVPLEQIKELGVCAPVGDSYPFTPGMLNLTSQPALAAFLYILAAAFLVSLIVRAGIQHGLYRALAGAILMVAIGVAATVLVPHLPTLKLDLSTLTGVFGFVAAIIVMGRLVAFVLFPNRLQSTMRERWRAFLLDKWGWTVSAFFILSFLCLAAIATRRTDFGLVEWAVLSRYILALLFAWLLGWQFTENANGLHRLYRDRLNLAFRLSRPKGKPLLLSDLDDSSPYLLVNATLNAREGERRDDSNPESKPDAGFYPDPAKRGRKAEFFLFSRFFVGSTATGYARTPDMETTDSQLDLATAAAISGAAVSSALGRVNIGLLGPTLALLNLRLGYWLANPRDCGARGTARRSAKAPKRSWFDSLRLYLFAEAFGQLSATSERVYLTDGGHIDNTGLYQLLKRRCRYIIVVDGEADPGMTFSAFCDAQRFARIDEGVRVTLDWMPIRDAVLKRMADRTKSPPTDDSVHDLHFAVGKIFYEKDDGDTEEGLLIYVKASMTGDEPDYVLDYERRYPLFPHESTGDQFFSEEQMEAYRALGFHNVAHFLSVAGNPGTEAGRKMAFMLKELKRTAQTDRRLRPRDFRNG